MACSEEEGEECKTGPSFVFPANCQPKCDPRDPGIGHVPELYAEKRQAVSISAAPASLSSTEVGARAD